MIAATLTAPLFLGHALPEKPVRPHDYFALPDHFALVEGVYRRPIRVRYKEAGAGPPLLLVHGLQTSSYSWRYVIDLLAKGHHVVALDLVGSGESDHPGDFGYAPEHVADFLEAFRATLARGDPSFARWDVCGNSLGGAYAAVYAARHPEAIRKLVIVHAPGFQDRAPVFGLEQLRRGRVPEFASVLFGPWLVRTYQRYRHPGILSEEEVAEYARPYRDREGRRAFWHVVREGLSPEAAARLPAELSAIRTPTLLVWADQDALIPAETGEKWRGAVAGARLEWVKDSSHFPQVEWPEKTAALIADFLDAK